MQRHLLSFVVLSLVLAATVSSLAVAQAPRGDDPPTLAPMLETVTPAVVNIAVLSRSPLPFHRPLS
jgi:hypothetical protein